MSDTRLQYCCCFLSLMRKLKNKTKQKSCLFIRAYFLNPASARQNFPVLAEDNNNAVCNISVLCTYRHDVVNFVACFVDKLLSLEISPGLLPLHIFRNKYPYMLILTETSFSFFF